VSIGGADFDKTMTNQCGDLAVVSPNESPEGLPSGLPGVCASLASVTVRDFQDKSGAGR
jgi:hypothetical protein